jgi:hypothetical protein
VRLAAVTAMATESLSIGGSHDRPTMTRPGIKVPGPAGVLRDAKQTCVVWVRTSPLVYQEARSGYTITAPPALVSDLDSAVRQYDGTDV